ncbi:Alpha/beta hydrolase family protein [Candidatus Bilamarchaeum dharawalense]|uniref:Alpha/beta hydrolase family protein n=1 Tax=Candidatus Bilamarchaeum dharawalense TaxID=2885759 RepID=A0A5E4LU60_9ARCH|nr:Alpha/beta hydrolase family protein [Candidatus Bilamarchaeum dharawalense]
MLIDGVGLTTSKTPVRGTIVTVNGWTCKMKYWGRLDPLSEIGYERFNFETKGHACPNHFRKLASELAKKLQEYGIHNPHLVVHSMGGLTAIAYLNLVKEPGYEDIRPASLTLVTPVLSDPKEMLPRGNLVLDAASAFTRWRIARVIRSIEDNGAPGECNEERSHRRIRTTLGLFQIASPLLFMYTGADKRINEVFANFLREAKTNDRVSTLMELYAMCTEGPELKQKLLTRDIWIPPKVLFVGGRHDLFVDAEASARIVMAALDGHTELRIKVMKNAGHFPFLEVPEQFNAELPLRV